MPAAFLSVSVVVTSRLQSTKQLSTQFSDLRHHAADEVYGTQHWKTCALAPWRTAWSCFIWTSWHGGRCSTHAARTAEVFGMRRNPPSDLNPHSTELCRSRWSPSSRPTSHLRCGQVEVRGGGLRPFVTFRYVNGLTYYHSFFTR